ncbi:MAG TPA: antibiotic biosynthesis monooxygenase [Devosia sp.]|nr:antibiotic biosynthesis monooxygenase [Devosia sp.]
MISLSVIYTIQRGKQAEVIEALKRMKRAVTDHEPGCLIYQVSKPRETDDTLILYEVYEDEEALSHHSTSPHFETIIKGQVIPMLVGRARTVCDVEIS